MLRDKLVADIAWRDADIATKHFSDVEGRDLVYSVNTIF